MFQSDCKDIPLLQEALSSLASQERTSKCYDRLAQATSRHLCLRRKWVSLVWLSLSPSCLTAFSFSLTEKNHWHVCQCHLCFS